VGAWLWNQFVWKMQIVSISLNMRLKQGTEWEQGLDRDLDEELDSCWSVTRLIHRAISS
jgi:hypothetical protein